jgi:hypothetical protein
LHIRPWTAQWTTWQQGGQCGVRAAQNRPAKEKSVAIGIGGYVRSSDEPKGREQRWVRAHHVFGPMVMPAFAYGVSQGSRGAGGAVVGLVARLVAPTGGAQDARPSNNEICRGEWQMDTGWSTSVQYVPDWCRHCATGLIGFPVVSQFTGLAA